MTAAAAVIDPQARDFYVDALTRLDEGGVPYLVGGAYAYARYTGIERHTKDFDIFVKRADYDLAVETLGKAGYATELSFPHWIGKAFKGEDFIDIIFSSGNGIAEVDDLWFKHAVPERVLGMDVKLIPAEEMIWSKGLIQERERYDGADVAHIIKNVGTDLDWHRVVYRYGAHWRVLYSHLILFGFIYPSRRSNVPTWVMEDLAARLAREVPVQDTDDKTCFGTILSRQQYLTDVQLWGFRDARLKPLGNMTAQEVAHWTSGIDIDGAK
jgi:hypothetical protein